MGLSAKEAADAVGISKQGIIKSITRGRISATKNKKGEWEIDPVELFRIYDPTNQVDKTDTSTNPKCISRSLPHVQPQTAALEERIFLLEERIRKLDQQLLKAEQREAWLMTTNEKITNVLENQTRILEYKPKNESGKGILNWLFG